MVRMRIARRAICTECIRKLDLDFRPILRGFYAHSPFDCSRHKRKGYGEQDAVTVKGSMLWGETRHPPIDRGGAN